MSTEDLSNESSQVEAMDPIVDTSQGWEVSSPQPATSPSSFETPSPVKRPHFCMEIRVPGFTPEPPKLKPKRKRAVGAPIVIPQLVFVPVPSYDHMDA